MNFDEYAEQYDLAMKRALPMKQDVFLRAKAEKLRQLTERIGLDCQASRVLDVGCGVGLMAQLLAPHYASLDGIDISEKSIEVAREAVPEGSFIAYGGGELPYPQDSFDVSVAVCVVHHVPPEQRRDFAREMVRVTRPGGLVAIFEHNPFNPLTRTVVARCEFDADAILLSAGETKKILRTGGTKDLECEFILVTPWRDKFSCAIERSLHSVPVGAQYVAYGRS